MVNFSNVYAVKLPYPPSVNNYWRISGNRMYISVAGRNFKYIVGMQCNLAGVKKIDGDVEIHMMLHPKTNKDGSTNKTRIDLDNGLKALLDALQGFAYASDSQVTRIIAELGEAIPNGGLTVVIREDYEPINRV